MATKKAAGATKNGRDSGPQYLGIKVTTGEIAQTGDVLVRQRGTVIMPGRNVGLGKDHTLFALKEGKVEYKNKRKINFDSSRSVRKIVHVA
ncbi:MAG: 50S ribosomal protein L27 [Patescibacteria group bacterium]|nr:50S ribosomal protein L27 [Patescibacteria group bacterium]